MISIFDKLERIQVNTLCLLSPEDKHYCDILLADYLDQLQFFTETLKQFEQSLKGFLEKRPGLSNAFISGIDNARKLVKHWKGYIEKQEALFIHRIESYFEQHYRLEFTSWSPPENEEPEEAVNEYQPLTSYEPLIQNITRQTGTNMVQAGKQNIIQAFRSNVRKEYAATLNGAKIILPDYYTLIYTGHSCLSEHDTRVDCLLRILVLHYDNTTTLAKPLADMYEQLKKVLELNRDYHVSKARIRFFKNCNVNILFPSPGEAQRFFASYCLPTDND
jgi:hypothetical protein